jgi:hypothetical protein
VAQAHELGPARERRELGSDQFPELHAAAQEIARGTPAPEIDLPTLPRSAEGPECCFRLDPPGPPRHDAQRWDHHWRSSGGAVCLSCAKDGSDYRLGVPGLATFAVRDLGREIVCRPESRLPDETIEHLLVDQILPRVLTLREEPSESRPLVLQQLLRIPATYHIVTEWRAVEASEAVHYIESMRTHFHKTKSSLSVSSGGDRLKDETKAEFVDDLNECLKEVQKRGNYFGKFSLTIVVYDRDRAKGRRGCCALQGPHHHV